MFSLSFSGWLEGRYWPLIGSEDPPEADPPEGDPAESDEDPAGGGEGDPPEEDPTPAAGDDPEEEPQGDADEDELDRVRKEREDLRKQLAKAEAAAQQAKKDARKAREDAAKKGGNWEQVAKERQAELEEANEQRQEAEKRAVLAEENLDKFQREVRITRLASKLSFRDPADAISQLKDQTELTGDDKSCERALRKLAEAKPYLVDQRRARGRAMGEGAENGNGPDFETLKNMSTEEINQAWERGDIQRTLTRTRPAART